MADIGSSVKLLLPPGFLFSPTDEELVLHFLYSKASLLPSHPNIIPDLDHDLSHLYPWELNGKTLSSGNQYYFFTKAKENRGTENGYYWKEIGVTEPIFSAVEKKVGIKKYLVFHIGESETNWVMQEYHIFSSAFDTVSYPTDKRRLRKPHVINESCSKWVLCRVYEKNNMSQLQGVNCYSDDDNDDDSGSELSWLDEVYLSLDDDLEEISMLN